jgi:hypothetical protein
VRMAVRKIIGGDTGVGSAQHDDGKPLPVEGQTSDVSGISGTRAPPAMMGRGS